MQARRSHCGLIPCCNWTQSKKEGHCATDEQVMAWQWPSLPQVWATSQLVLVQGGTQALVPPQTQLATSQTVPWPHSPSLVQLARHTPQPAGAPGGTQLPVMVQSLLLWHEQLVLHTGGGPPGLVQPEKVWTPLQPTQ